jgi:uncharacterized membrane protein
MLLLILSFVAATQITRFTGMRFTSRDARFWTEAQITVVLFVIALVLL